MEKTAKKTAYVRDMTEGNIIKHIIIFSIPIIIATACQQLYSLVDTVVAGHNLGDNAIAAIGATASVYTLILNLAVGFNNGCGVVVTQYFGSHDRKSLKQAIMTTYMMNAAITTIVTIIALTCMNGFLHAMNVPAEIYDEAYTYIMVLCGGMVTTVLYNMFSGILRGFGNSRAPLVFVVVSSILHIVLDIIFINNLKMGVFGTAVSTVLSQAVSAAMGWIYTVRNYKEYLPSKEDIRVPKHIVKEVIRIGLSMGLMYSVVNVGTVLFQSANNSLGDVYITAYTSARRVIDLSHMPLNMLATAFATFAAQNWGAKQYSRIRDGIKKLMVMEVVCAVTAMVIVYALAPQMIRAITGTENADIISNAVLDLQIHMSMYIPLGTLFAFRMSFQGMGRTDMPVISSTIEMLFKVFSTFFLIPKFGFVGTCCTEPTTWLLCAIFLTVSYFTLKKKGLYPDLR